MAVAALTVLGFAYAAGAIFGLLRYRTPLNPLTFTAVVTGGITLLSGGIVYSQLGTAPYTADDVMRTAMVALVAFIGTLSPYLFRGNALSGLFGQVVRLLGLESERIATRFRWSKFGLLLAAAVASFLALAVLGGGGLRWLTDSRGAYIANRAGAGPFFAAVEWFLVFALLYYLWSRRAPRLLPLFAVVMLFAIAASFTGSKGNILIMFVLFVAYYQYRIRPIPLTLYLLMIPVFLGVFGTLLLVQGFDQANVLMTLVYFKDYFDTAAQFLSRFNEFEYRYGAATLSELWQYVPRAIYPDKPFEYGLLSVHAVLFPGFAETGNTPGVLPWTTAYLDFGAVGVFVWGVAGSLLQRAAYEYYLQHRRSLFAFIFMMQFALWAPLPFATTAMSLVLCLSLGVYFRLTLKAHTPSRVHKSA
jgi:oligosaccharide repeat unit polymerase